MKYKRIILILTFLILLDQIIKSIIINKNIDLLSNIFSLTYTENFGIAFGIEQSTLFTILISIILIIIIICFLYRYRKYKQITIPVFLILTGSIGNLIDRIVRGYVIDYINIEFLNFPIFNLSDIYIFIGVIYLMYSFISNKKIIFFI